MNTHKFPIGTQYYARGKRNELCTVVDRLTTYNEAGEIVQMRYVAAHDFCGQQILDRDVVETTIARAIGKGEK